MDSFEFNKLIGAFLGVVFLVFSMSLISDAIFAAPAPDRPGYVIEAAEEEAAAGGEAPAAESVLPLLASADIGKGEAVYKRCAACHTDDASGANKIGPNLWGIVNRPVAGHEGFAYSAAMKEFAQGGSVVWDYEHLDHFLLSPKGLVRGTAMGFAGLKNVQDRADVIMYLRSKADSEAPLPEVAAPAPENASAPAEGAPAAEPAAPADGAAPAEPAPAQ